MNLNDPIHQKRIEVGMKMDLLRKMHELKKYNKTETLHWCLRVRSNNSDEKLSTNYAKSILRLLSWECN